MADERWLRRLNRNFLQLAGLDEVDEEIPFLVGEHSDVAFLTDFHARWRELDLRAVFALGA